MQFSRINDPSQKRTELLKVEPMYEEIRDCLGGSMLVKHRRTKYLPKPDPTGKDADERYEAYLKRAVFYNVVGETNEMFQGQLQLKPPKIELPETLEPLRLNADGQGLSLQQMIKDASACVVPFSRGGWYCEFPKLPRGQRSFTLQDFRDGKLPTINFIKPWDILNWHEERIGNQKRLTMVVIKQRQECRKPEDLAIEYRDVYKVMVLEGPNRDRAVVYAVGRGEQNGQSVFVSKRYDLRGADGQPLRVLPFKFIGSQNNDAHIDTPLLYPMADLNLAHYRCSADFFESAFRLGQPTPLLTGLTRGWVENVLHNKLTLGSNNFVPLPEKSDGKYLQVEPNILAQQGMQELESQMIKLGAELVQGQSKVERKEVEVQAESSSKSSKLGKIATNLETSLCDILKIAYSFMNRGQLGEDDIQVSINKVYNAGAKTLSQLVSLASLLGNDDPPVTLSEIREQFRIADIAYLTDEQAKEENDAMIKARSDRALEVARANAAIVPAGDDDDDDNNRNVRQPQD